MTGPPSGDEPRPSARPSSRGGSGARVLVTDGEQRSTLAVVRSLGRAGYHLLVAARVDRPLAGASRFARATRKVPDPSADAAAYRDAIAEIVADEGVDVLIPMTDVSASLLLELRESHPGLTVPFPGRDVYEAVSDKARLMEVASGLGVPTPEQLVIQGPDEGAVSEARAWAASRSFDVVLKPARSVVVEGGRVSKTGVAVIGDEADFESALRAYANAAVPPFPLLLQRRVHGPGLGAFLLTRDGEAVAHFAHRRLREKPPTGGVSVYRESVPLDDDLRTHSERILRAYAWTGVAMVEFKREARTGTPYLMEVNGRFWGSLQLAIDAGVDFPRLLMSRTDVSPAVQPVDAVDAPPNDRPYRIGVRSRWLWGDVDHLIWMLRASRSTLSLHPELPSRAAALARFLVPWRPGDRYEILRARDARPFFRESVSWLRDLLR